MKKKNRFSPKAAIKSIISCALLAVLLLKGNIAFSQSVMTVGDGAVISIPSGTYLSTNGDLVIGDGSSGGNAALDNGGTVQVEGTFENDAAGSGGLITSGVTGGTGTVLLDGASQNIQGSVSTTFYNLTLGGTGIKSLVGVNSTVTGTLNLANIELAAGVNSVLITGTGTIINTIGSPSGFVSNTSGYLSRQTVSTGTYYFPVGGPGGGLFRPIEIQPAASSSNTYNVRYVNGSPTSSGYTATSTDGTICSVNTLYYHNITQNSAQAAILTMYFSSAVPEAFQAMAHWQGAPLWTNMGTVSTLSGYGLSGLRTSSNWSDFTTPAFALASSPVPAPPVATAATNNTSCTSFTANWNASIVTSTQGTPTNYLLQVSTDGQFGGSFVSGFNPYDAGTSTSVNVTGLSSGTTYYYRVLAKNGCGSSAYSNIISVLTSASGTPANSSVPLVGIVGTDYDGYITTAKKYCGAYTGGANPPQANGTGSTGIPDLEDIGFGGINGANLAIPVSLPGGVQNPGFNGLNYKYTTNSLPSCGGSFFILDASTFNTANPAMGCSGYNDGSGNYYALANSSALTLTSSVNGSTNILTFTGTTKVSFLSSGSSGVLTAYTVNIRYTITAPSGLYWNALGSGASAKYYLKIPGATTFTVNVKTETDLGTGWASGMSNTSDPAYYNTQQGNCPYAACTSLYPNYTGGSWVGINRAFYSEHSGNGGGFNSTVGRIYNAFNPSFQRDQTGPAAPAAPVSGTVANGGSVNASGFTVTGVSSAPTELGTPDLPAGYSGTPYQLWRSDDNGSTATTLVGSAVALNTPVTVNGSNLPTTDCSFRKYWWRAYDACGNYTQSATALQVFYDNTVPTYNSTTITGADCVAGSIYYIKNGTTVTVNVNHSDNCGTGTQYLEFSNGVGNIGSWFPATGNVKAFAGPYGVNNGSSYTGWGNDGGNGPMTDPSRLTISPTVTCVASGNCSTNASGNWSVTAGSGTSRSYVVDVFMYDRAGNGVGYTNTGLTLYLDNDLPSTPGTPTVASGGGTNTQTWSISASTDIGSGVTGYDWQYSTTGSSGPWTALTTNANGTTTSPTINLTCGQLLWVQARSKDCAGNYSPWSSTASGNAYVIPAIGIQPSDQTICANGNASFVLGNVVGSGLIYQWQVSTDGGATFNDITAAGSNPTYAGYNSSATLGLTNAPFGTDGYQYRCVLTGTCPPIVTSLAGTLHVASSTIVSVSGGNTSVCTNASVTLTANSNTLVNVYQWQSSPDNFTWSAASGTNNASTYNVSTVSAGTTYYQVTVSSNCNNATSTNSQSVMVVDQPGNPTLNTGSTTPSNGTIVCTSATITVYLNAGTNGTGTIQDYYRYSLDNGGTWLPTSSGQTMSGATNFNITAPGSPNTILVQTLRTASALNCNSSWGQVASYQVVDQPGNPTLNTTSTTPASGSIVCTSATISVYLYAGTNGSGTIQDYYRYSLDNGASWLPSSGGQTMVGATNFNITAPAVANTILVQTQRTSSGTGCSGTGWVQVANYTVVTQPGNPTLNAGSTSPSTGSSVCTGATLSIYLNGGTDGTGTIQDYYRYSLDNGGSWLPSSSGQTMSGATTFNITAPGVANTVLIQTLRTASGANCNSSWGQVATYSVVAQPTVSTNPTNSQTVCTNASVTLTAGVVSGTGNYTYQWYSNTANSFTSPVPVAVGTSGTIASGAATTNYTPVTASTGTMYYFCTFSPQNATNCGPVNSTMATVIVLAQPAISTQPTSPPAICGGASTSLTTGATAGGSTITTYQWQYFDGSVWQNLGLNLPAAGFSYPSGTAGASLTTLNINTVNVTTPSGAYQFRCVVSFSGNGCTTSLTSNTATVTVIPYYSTVPTPTAATNVSCSGFTANWGSVANATGYDIEVSASPTFSSILASYSNLAGLSQAVSGGWLNSGTYYYYHVRARFPCTNSAYSTTYTTVLTTSVTIPTLPVNTVGITQIDYDGYITTGKKNCWFYDGSGYHTTPFADPLDMGYGGGVNGAPITIPGHSAWSGFTQTYSTNSPPCGAYMSIDLGNINGGNPDLGVSLSNVGGNPFATTENHHINYSSGLNSQTLVLTGTTRTEYVNSSGNVMTSPVTVNTRIKLTVSGTGVTANAWKQNGTKYYVNFSGPYTINVLAEADVSAWNNGMYTNNSDVGGCPYNTCPALYASYAAASSAGTYQPIFWFFNSQHGANNIAGQLGYNTPYAAFNPTYGVVTPPVVGVVTQPTCSTPTGSVVLSGLPSGTWTLTPSSGTPVTSTGSSYTFTGLAPSNNYTFVVSDASGFQSCASAVVTINAAPAVPPITAVTVTQPTCAIPTASIVIVPTSSTLYQYSIDGTTFPNTTGTISGIAPSSSLTVKLRLVADNNCVSIWGSNPVTINAVPTVPPITAVTVTQPTCAIPTASIVIVPTSSTLYQYSSDGTTFPNTTGTISGIAPSSSLTVELRLVADNTCVSIWGSNPVTINAVPASLNVSNFTTTATTPICSGGVSTVTIGSTTLGNGTYTATYDLSAPNAATGLTASFTISSNSGTFSTPVLNNTGTTTVTITSVANASNCSSTPSSGNTADVVVNAGPVVTITGAVDVCVGGQITLTAGVTGGGGSITDLTWQRRVNAGSWGSVQTGTGTSYLTDNTLVTGSYDYEVILTQSGANCSATSSPVSANVADQPHILSDPTGASICKGGTVVLSAAASGGTPSTLYQWEYAGSGIVTNNNPTGVTYSGETGNTLTISTDNTTTPPGITSYWLTVYATGIGCNAVDVVTSTTADVIITADPVVSNPAPATQPVICSGGTPATISVTASGGTGTILYQWYSNTSPSNTGGTLINGANSAGYDPPATPGTTYYYCVVSQAASGCGPVTTALTAEVVVGGAVTANVTADQCMNAGASANNYYVLVYGSGGTGTYTYHDGATPTPNAPLYDVAAINGNPNMGLFEVNTTSTNNDFTVVDGSGCTATTHVDVPAGGPTTIVLTASGTVGTTDLSVLDCHIDGWNKWITFIETPTATVPGPASIALNPGANNLGLVTVTTYKDNFPPVIWSNQSTWNCTWTQHTAMRRHFKVTTANAVTQGTVGVRLFFTEQEFQDLKSDAWNNNIAYPNAGYACTQLDDVYSFSGQNPIFVTKYTDPNPGHATENGNYLDNLPSGIYKVYSQNTVTQHLTPGQYTGTGTGFQDPQLGYTNGDPDIHYVELNVSEFSEFWLHGSQQSEALPVEMIYLQADAVNNAYIQVSWATATEINNAGFAVERSMDGQTWSQIGWVDGHNNATSQNNYSYNDMNVVPDVVYYYRLKQVDNDGAIQYTDIVSARLSGEVTFSVKDFVPNPTMDKTSLIITATKDQEIRVTFYDVIGQKMMESSHEISRGGNRIEFDLGKLAAGTYTAVVSSANEVYSKKVVLTK